MTDQLPAPVAERGIDKATWCTLMNNVFPGADSKSVLMVVDYCKARGLDPLKKPVHIVPMKVKDAKTGAETWRDVVMPGIAEYRVTAMRTGRYAGKTEPQFGPDVEFLGVVAPEYCTITVYRLIEGHRCPFTATVYFSEECATKDRGASLNPMWKKRPRGQLAKCAEAQALRMAFPEESGGLNTADELEGKTITLGGNEFEELHADDPVANLNETLLGEEA